MDSNYLLILSAYSAAIFAASLLGGKLSALGTMTHTRSQIVMSLVAGFILGIAMYHLLPHSIERIAGPDRVEKAVGWMVFGMVLMIFLLRIFHFHQHDLSSEASDLYDRRGPGGVHSQSLLGIALGLGIHTATEGIALGASVHNDSDSALAGLGVFLAILLHKPLDAYFIIGMMQSAGHSQRTCTVANVGFALLCPVMVLASFWGVGLLGPEKGAMVGYALAFAAGAFLCIALSDLLPEIHFHSHDRGKLTAALLVGIGLAYALYYVESGVL